ncbi:hypothetical protein [Rossellomorea aquimaris]|uniref:hypothetical protein n=1 Tax=Rossellomorea aquimaris TaxID=189382 RepID=UPI001CFD41EC|nr:hypothetical protein [Rossellomorea aquimaris]
MKKDLKKWVILFLLVMGSLGVFNLVSHKGKFEKVSHVSVNTEMFNENQVVYLSYLFKWEGIGTPTLEKVELMKSDGTTIGLEDEPHFVKSFISKVDFGSMEEKEAIKEGLVQSLLPVKGYKADNDYSLALRVQPKYFESDHDISSIRISYKKFGQSHVQNISFDEGIVSD